MGTPTHIQIREKKRKNSRPRLQHIKMQAHQYKITKAKAETKLKYAFIH